jgi:hypothetical protein
VIVSSWSEVITTDYKMYFFADHWTPVGEEVTFEDDNGLSRARLTGFLGMRSPWSAIVLCGTHNGPVRLTVEIHDAYVDATDIGHRWSEVIQTGFETRSGRVTFLQLFGEEITTIELLPLGAWAMRAHARGRDEGHAERSYHGLDAEPLEEHLIQFWPGPSYGDLVLTQDRTGASARGG